MRHGKLSQLRSIINNICRTLQMQPIQFSCYDRYNGVMEIEVMQGKNCLCHISYDITDATRPITISFEITTYSSHLPADVDIFSVYIGDSPFNAAKALFQELLNDAFESASFSPDFDWMGK